MSKFASTPEEMNVGGSLQTEMKSAMARLASAQSKGDQDEIKRSQYDVDSITSEMNKLSRKGGSKLGGLIPVPDVPAPQAPAQAAVQPLAGSKIGYDAWDQTGASIKASAPVVVPYAFPADGTPKPVTGPGTVALEANAEFAGAAKDYAATQSISFVDQLKADWGVNGVSAQFSEFMRARDQVPTKGFSPFKHEPTAYVGKDEEGFEILDGAVNVQDFEERKARLKQIEDARRITFAHGALQGFGVSMATSLPTDLAVGLVTTGGFWGLGIGAVRLARRGQRLAALGSSYAEAAVGNLAVTGTMDALGQHTDSTAYAADLVASLLGPAAEARSIGKLATAAEFERTAAQVAAARVTRIERLATEARANLPANASKQEVEAEIAKLEAQKMVEATTPAQGNRLLDELEVEPEAPSVKAYAYDDADIAARARAAMDSADKTATMDLIGRQGDDVRIKNYIPEDAPTHVKDAGLAVEDLARTFLPDHVRVGVAWTPGQSVSGFAESSGPVVRIGMSDIGTAGGKGLQVAVHEVTHAMNAYYLPNYVDKPALLADFGKFIDTVKSGDLEKATRMRWASKSEPVNPKRAYDLNFDEWLAEQSAKYANETAAAGGNPGLRAELTAKLREWADRVLALFGKAKDKGYIPVDQSVKDYVDAIRNREVQPVKFARPVTALSDAASTVDPIARKYGLDLMPVDNPRASAEQKQLIGLYRRADAWAQANPMDAAWAKRVDTLNKNRLFNVASTSANMLMSKNPVARMLAAELLESPSGVAGRKATASIRKYMAERKLMGNSINEFQTAFDQYRKLNGIGWSDNFMGSKGWRDFNRAVSLEIEGRKSGRPSQFDESIRLGADVMEAGYERARLMQVEGRTTGFGNLPDSSVGYMPHRMSALTIRNATPEQLRAVHGVLTDQFIEGNGFDLTFADKLASKYLERVQRRAVGDYDGAIGVNQVGSMDLIEEAVEELGLTVPELRAVKEKLARAGAGHTKTRLKLDLNKEIGDGTRLVDLFETDHIKLLRGQAHRVSGEFALAQHGIMGMGGLKTLRKALQFGEGGAKAEEEAIAAFDQVAAEFMGQPFGNSIGKYGDRVMILNSLSRLGGMGFTQLAEAVNGVPAVGFMRTLNSMGSMGRLNSEIRAMARGEKVDNPILGSVEQWGAEFGTDSYKLVFPFDVPDHAYSTYGTDTVSNADRLLRMASHAQAKVTFWRAIHGAQQRGMAEQVVRKAATFLRNGGEDKALADMGFNPDLLARLRGDLDNMAKWDGDKLVEFDINKATDREAAEAFVHAVHRGTSQIIQGTFIGETGKWAHEGWLKILTQFRTFSIVAMEKQWGRNANNYGAAKAAGILLGSMIMVAPIAMARAYAASIGRENQDEYLEKRLTFGAISRATLTMVANSGYAPDVLDALGAVTGTAEMTGGRAGTESQAVGNLIAPSVGWVDDVWGGVQNTRDGTDPTKLMRTLPFGNHPALTPIINSLAQ